MDNPHDIESHRTSEIPEAHKWFLLSTQGVLDVVGVIAGWSDICGFENKLKNANWDLESIKKEGVFGTLHHTYRLLGRPFTVVPFGAGERVLIINDGVARTLDIEVTTLEAAHIVLYIKNLVMHHYQLEELLFEKGLGLRTTLAAGERCQYAPTKLTGESLLHHPGSPSHFGEWLQDQQFVYNPAEFQMNTGFALAYTLDKLGSKAGITPNRLYFEEGWIKALETTTPGLIERQNNSLEFTLNGKPALSLVWDKCFSVNGLGRDVTVYRVSAMTVRHGLESEETHFSMSCHDQWATKV